VAADGKEAAKKLVAEGKALAKDGKTVAARAKLLEAVKADVAVEGGKDALTEAESQLKNLAFFVLGEKTLATKKWQEGIDALKKIPEASPLTASAKALLGTLEQRYLLDQAVLLQTAFAKKDWAGAKAALEPMLKQMPTSSELQSAKNAIDKASAADADVLDVTALDASDARVKAPPKVPAQDFKAAFEAYAKSAFEQAVNAFDGVQFGGQASKGDVARSQFFSALVTANSELWKVANEAQAAGKFDDALSGYRKAKVLDTMLGGQLRSKVDAELVKVYAAQAKKAGDDKKPFDAALWAGRAVALDPKAAAAKATFEPAVKDAKANLAKAKAAAKEQPDQALEAAVKALQLLPPEDADYAAATSLADELLKL
jgi:tetratricopeptide (TPR) repeat protein